MEPGLRFIHGTPSFGRLPLGRNKEHASLEAMRLTDFLPTKDGSEQRPHQKTQSIHCGSLPEKLPKLERALSILGIKKEEGENREYGINARGPRRVRRELNPRPSD